MTNYITSILNKNTRIKKWNESDVEDIYNAIINKTEFPTKVKKVHLSFSGGKIELFDLREINLSKRDLSNGDLTYCLLDRADLSFSNLSHCQLQYSRLRNANLKNSILNNTQASPIDAQGAILNQANISSSYFMHANFKGIEIRQIKENDNFFSNGVRSLAELTQKRKTGIKRPPKTAAIIKTRVSNESLTEWMELIAKSTKKFNSKIQQKISIFKKTQSDNEIYDLITAKYNSPPLTRRRSTQKYLAKRKSAVLKITIPYNNNITREAATEEAIEQAAIGAKPEILHLKINKQVSSDFKLTGQYPRKGRHSK